MTDPARFCHLPEVGSTSSPWIPIEPQFYTAISTSSVNGRKGISTEILIVLGSYLLVKPWVEQQHLFGKAEEGRA